MPKPVKRLSGNNSIFGIDEVFLSGAEGLDVQGVSILMSTVVDVLEERR